MIIVGITAFLGSLLTLFSGFGLGTLLTPVFGLFFPIHISIALTGIVHLLNNFFKLSLLGKNINKDILLKFGIPSVIGGFIGAFCLIKLHNFETIYTWHWGEKICNITPLKLLVAILMLFFAFMEIIPALKNLKFPKNLLSIGGLVSGFFGGLSGNQGALRSAFLINAGLSKESFIATGVVIACLVDLTRLPLYFSNFQAGYLQEGSLLLVVATLSAFAGAYIGAKFLKKVTLEAVQYFTAAMIVVFALMLGLGII
jgi:uncharacterized protein